MATFETLTDRKLAEILFRLLMGETRGLKFFALPEDVQRSYEVDAKKLKQMVKDVL